MNAELVKISERIRDHLLAQRAVSSTGGSCKYRSRSGKMCAVGCLIDEEFYSPGFEGKGVNTVTDAVVASLRKRGMPNVKDTAALAHLLGQWQNYHDNGKYENWIAGLVYPSGAIGPSEFHNNLITINGHTA